MALDCPQRWRAICSELRFTHRFSDTPCCGLASHQHNQKLKFWNVRGIICNLFSKIFSIPSNKTKIYNQNFTFPLPPIYMRFITQIMKSEFFWKVILSIFSFKIMYNILWNYTELLETCVSCMTSPIFVLRPALSTIRSQLHVFL